MLDAGGGGGVPSMDGFMAAAASGAFAVSATGGQALLKAIRDLAAVVDNNIADLSMNRRTLPLGGSNGANQMKPYMQDVLTDEQGFITRLKEFRASLVDAETAINAAMANYDSTESAVQGNFRVV
jgi:hypothetical protein